MSIISICEGTQTYRIVKVVPYAIPTPVLLCAQVSHVKQSHSKATNLNKLILCALEAFELIMRNRAKVAKHNKLAPSRKAILEM